MSKIIRFKRESGVVMPIFSLPSPYGIGTFGKSAYNFIDQLVKAGQRYWQILPLGHTGFGDSPYQTFSIIAGNPYFIDLDMLVEDGILDKTDLKPYEGMFDEDEVVNYEKVSKIRSEVLKIAYMNSKNNNTLQEEITKFINKNLVWLKDYAMFMAIKSYFSGKPVWDWEDSEIKKHTPEAIRKYYLLLQEDIEYYYFIQYFFFKQWHALKKYANKKGILFIGDIPMYPSPDSADVWAHRNLFKVDENLVYEKVAGVPPDIYSATGQLWGNPIYNWEIHEKENFKWWISRIRYQLQLSDVIRIDHFRAFQDYWEIPGNEKTALNGKWMPGPRMKLINAIKKEVGDIPIIAEDLGIITDDVRKLLQDSGFPGMNVIIFGISENDDSTHLPHNYKINSVGYTSTHDSETFCDAVKKASANDKDFILNYINYNPNKESLGMASIRTVWASSARIAMTMVSDILSLEEEGRINTPSTIGGNWNYRLKPGQLTDELLNNLKTITKLYKRNQ